MDAGAAAAWWPASPAAELLHDRRAVIPVIGAGLSAAAGMPSSAELAARLATWLPGDADADERDNLFAVADAAFHATPGARQAIQRDIAAAITDAPVRLTEAHRALVTVRSRVLVTFNYDEVLEEAARQARIPWDACTYRETEKLVEQLRARERHRLLIYHAHGSVADHTSIVVDDAGYRELSNDRAVSRAFEHLADLNTLCFLGTRLDEPYLQATLLRLPSSYPRHVLIGDDATLEEVARPSRRGALLPWRYGIVTCSLGQDWSVLAGFCRRLAGRSTPRTIEVPAAAPAPSPFVEPIIGLRATTPSAEIATLMGLAFPDHDAVAQSDVVRAWRALVTAPAGSGKSTVLRHIAAHQPETECPVIIELHQLLQLRGSPDALLERWVTQGEAVGRTEVDLDSRLFLLLDGFDEIDAYRQEEAAETIVALAESFPQHRLLVTSRRMPALEALPRAGFTEFELWTTRITATRLLWARGTTLERVRHRLPEFHQLGSLATNPLVLDTLIDLAERVPADMPPFERLLWMLEAIVERLCTRESRRIAYTPAELRRAVGAVAAVLQLFDLRAVAVESLSDVGEPLFKDAAMSRRLLHDAALRLLSTGEDEGTFAFISSALAAFLAADHILRVDPDATDALSAVTPAIGHDFRMRSPKDSSDLVARVERAGVRSDLREAASILAARSDSWADALWVSDPLLVARVASRGCARPGARVRARELWRAIQKGEDASWWFIQSEWLPAPAVALGTLLRERPYPRMERELVAAALGAGNAAGPALIAMAMTDRLAPRTLTRIVKRAPPRSAASVVRALRIVRRGDLLGPVIKQQLAAAAQFGPAALDDVSHMVAEDDAGPAVLDALAGADPDRAGKSFWDLVGVVRVAGSPDDVVGLWIVLLGKHRQAFERYAAENPLVVVHLVERHAEIDGRTARLNEAGYESLRDFLGGFRAQMRRDSLPLEALAGEDAGFATTTTEPEPSEAPGAEERPKISPLLPRRKFRKIIERIVLELAPSETDYSSFIPDEEGMVAQIQRQADPPDKDPVVLINERLAAASSAVSDLDGVLDALLDLDAWSRRRVGIRLEEAVPALAPGSGSSRRVAFLRRWGVALGLAPTEDEWLSLAAGESDRSYLALHPPPLLRLRAALRRGDAARVLAVLAAAPAGWRMLVLDDVIAALKSAAAGEVAMLELASLIAQVPRRAEGIARLREAFPQFAGELAGWAAAAGDRDALAPAFASFLRAAEAGDEARVFRSGGAVDWFEDALERLPPGTLEPMSVIRAVPATMVAFGGGTATVLIESLGALAIANAPLMTASTLAMLCLIHGTDGPALAFEVLRDAAIDGAHRAAGVHAAAAPLGTTRDAVLGRRNLADVDIQRAESARRFATAAT